MNDQPDDVLAALDRWGELAIEVAPGKREPIVRIAELVRRYGLENGRAVRPAVDDTLALLQLHSVAPRFLCCPARAATAFVSPVATSSAGTSAADRFFALSDSMAGEVLADTWIWREPLCSGAEWVARNLGAEAVNAAAWKAGASWASDPERFSAWAMPWAEARLRQLLDDDDVPVLDGIRLPSADVDTPSGRVVRLGKEQWLSVGHVDQLAGPGDALQWLSIAWARLNSYSQLDEGREGRLCVLQAEAISCGLLVDAPRWSNQEEKERAAVTEVRRREANGEKGVRAQVGRDFGVSDRQVGNWVKKHEDIVQPASSGLQPQQWHSSASASIVAGARQRKA